VTDELTRAEPAAIAMREDENAQRTVEMRIVPYGVTAQTSDGPERFARGAFRGVDASRVTIEAGRHGGPLVGRGLSLEERDDAAYLTARIAPTAAGDELLTLTREGVYQDVSVVFVPRTSKRAADGVTERQAVDLRRVAILERGAYPGAAVVAVRSEPDDTEVADMGETVDITPVVDRLERMEQRMEQMAVTAATPAAAAVHPLMQYRSLGEYMTAALEQPELARALADITTSDNSGLVHDYWTREITEILNFGRPAITAFGTAPLPDTGMSVRWPSYIPSEDPIIGEQEGQKTEIVSSIVQFGYDTAYVKTFAGGADISYQLIRRSDPSFLDAWGRVMAAAWAKVTDTYFVDAAWNAPSSFSNTTYDIDADTTGGDLLTALFQASVDIETATGQPAQFALASTSAFTKLAAMSRIVPAYPGNMSMAAGNATANSLIVNVNGLPIIHDRNIAGVTGGIDDAFLVSNRATAKWLEQGPFTVTAEDVAKLGQNVAVWSLGANAFYYGEGLVWIYNAGA
jgi:phage head maturation protease